VARAAPSGDAWCSIVKRTQSVRVRNEDEFRVPRTATRISPDGETYAAGEVFVHVKERSDVLPVPYEATVSHAQLVLPLQRQTRKLSEALSLDTPASKLTVSLLSVACSPAVIMA
jgi:hypothetical protein